MIEQLSGFLCTLLNGMWGAINSNLAIAFIGGFMGAFGGAFGAQRIVERNKHSDDLIKELRNTNSAIMVAFSICNAALSLKQQHVLPMHENFEKEKVALNSFMDQRAKGEISGSAEYQFTADLKIYPAPTVPTETLKGLVYSKVSAYGRTLALVAVLEQSLAGLKDAIATRDTIVQTYKTTEIPPEQFHHYYFGLPLQGGITNQEYGESAWITYYIETDTGEIIQLPSAELEKVGQLIQRPLSFKTS